RRSRVNAGIRRSIVDQGLSHCCIAIGANAVRRALSQVYSGRLNQNIYVNRIREKALKLLCCVVKRVMYLSEVKPCSSKGCVVKCWGDDQPIPARRLSPKAECQNEKGAEFQSGESWHHPLSIDT